jgi:hypothetical protein
MSMFLCEISIYRVIKSLCAPDDYSKKIPQTIDELKMAITEYGPCYTEHGLRENSSVCQ